MSMEAYVNTQPRALSGRGEGPNPIDVHVGARLKLRRTLLGLSQERLSESVRITFQQLQKYERGTNRISASRLYNLSRVLDVPVSYFFDNLPGGLFEEEDGSVLPQTDAGDEGDGSEAFASMAHREALELVRAYSRIGRDDLRRRAFDLIKALGGEVAEQAFESTGAAAA